MRKYGQVHVVLTQNGCYIYCPVINKQVGTTLNIMLNICYTTIDLNIK